MIDITIGVTCYNEERSIVPTLQTILAAFEENHLQGEIIVMDDASADSSVRIVREFIEKNPGVRIDHHVNPSNMGMVWNVYEAACRGSGRHYWFVAGDSNVTADACSALFSNLGAADIIIPHVLRYENRAWVRHVISRAYVAIVNLLSGRRIKYYNGSAIYLRTDVVGLKGKITEFSYSADMIIRLLDQGRTYVEVPVVYNERAVGRSSALSWPNLWGIMVFMGRLIRRRVSTPVDNRFNDGHGSKS